MHDEPTTRRRATSAPPPPQPAVPERLDTAAAWAWRLLLVVGALLALGWLALRLSVVTLPLMAAVLITAALWPLREAVHERGRSTTVSAAAAFAVLLTLLLVLALLVGPPAVMQAGELDESVRAGAADLPAQLGGLGISREDAERAVDGAADALHDNARGIGSGVFEAVLVAANLAAAALLCLVLTFFFLKDGPTLWRGVLGFLPHDRRHDIDKDGRAAFASLSSFIRAQALVATIDAIGIGLAVALVGAPLALPVAVLTFVLAFVPVVGAITSGAVAALVALAFGGLGDALIVLGAAVLVQQLEGNVLFPLLVGRSVQMHPVVVLLALATGGTLAGIGGAVMAVPIAAAVTGVRNERRSRAMAPEVPDEIGRWPGAPHP